jgi:hypothetical protein
LVVADWAMDVIKEEFAIFIIFSIKSFQSSLDFWLVNLQKFSEGFRHTLQVARENGIQNLFLP